MVNKPKKPNKTQTNTINSILLEKKLQPKSRQQIYAENYQKNKEKKKAQQKERYLQKKEKEKEQLNKQLNKYCQASNIKILLPFKEYINLNQQKHKLWLDFQWTLKECAKNIRGVIDVMRLRELADNLIKDYEETAKKEVRKGKNWNLLDYDQQQKLTRYWGYEKARIENGYLGEAERLEKQSQTYLKDLESAKFHEERGKINCECYRCAESKRIQGEIKKELSKKEQFPECKKWIKELEGESGVCKSCRREYE